MSERVCVCACGSEAGAEGGSRGKSRQQLTGYGECR